MVWLIYWPLLLVVAAAIAAGVAILVRRLRHQGDNPFVVPPANGESQHQDTGVQK
jgi:hypothetical protein